MGCACDAPQRGAPAGICGSMPVLCVLQIDACAPRRLCLIFLMCCHSSNDDSETNRPPLPTQHCVQWPAIGCTVRPYAQRGFELLCATAAGAKSSVRCVYLCNRHQIHVPTRPYVTSCMSSDRVLSQHACRACGSSKLKTRVHGQAKVGLVPVPCLCWCCAPCYDTC